METAPRSMRLQIAVAGRTNSGKSSFMNLIAGQDVAITSPVPGTTTDPVSKAMEIHGIGACLFIDTPGFDDEGELGSLRVKKSYQVLNKTDAAVLVIDGTAGAAAEDKRLLERIRKKNIPFIVVINKKELTDAAAENAVKRSLSLDDGQLALVSAATGEGIRGLKERIALIARTEEPEKYLVRDLLEPSDIAVLVVPIDSAAPKGRLILPQQQTIRDILEADAVSVVVKENGLKDALGGLKKKPKMVITDSQVFAQVAADTPEDILLTSFSILMARYKGNLEQAVRGVTALDRLEDGDTVLISEGCTHHRQCDDIGTVKIPGWIREYTGKDVQIAATSGTEFPDDLKKYKLIIHCGGCMLNEREMKYRLSCAADQEVPMTNYGIMIAYVKGILKRSVQVFPDISALLK